MVAWTQPTSSHLEAARSGAGDLHLAGRWLSFLSFCPFLPGCGHKFESGGGEAAGLSSELPSHMTSWSDPFLSLLQTGPWTF